MIRNVDDGQKICAEDGDTQDHDLSSAKVIDQMANS